MGKRHFDLPRVGQTVVVREEGHTRLIKVTWHGAKFVRESEPTTQANRSETPLR
jgi:hypothetical protein